MNCWLKFDTDYISHHGVKDMHWGVRNGPPYPLSSKISTGKRLKGGYGGKGSVKDVVKKVFKKNQKPSLEKTYKDLDDLNANMLKRNQDLMKQTYGGKNVEPSKDKPKKSIEQDVKDLNKVTNSNTNCTLCSMAYELRRRNLKATVTKDVSAGLSTEEVWDMYGMKGTKEQVYSQVKFPSDEIFKDKNNIRIKTAIGFDPKTGGISAPMAYEVYSEKALTNYISKKYPDGSRGIFLAPWAASRAYGIDAGHCVSWEINKGKLSIIDAQANTKVKNIDEWLDKVYCYDMIELRTDDKSINKKYIKKGGIK